MTRQEIDELSRSKCIHWSSRICDNAKPKPDICPSPQAIVKNNLENKSIKVMQINFKKSNSAMQELTINLRKETHFIPMYDY